MEHSSRKIKFSFWTLAEWTKIRLIKITFEIKTKINVRICKAPTQPFRAVLGAESRVCYPGNIADRQTQSTLKDLLPLAVNSKSEVNSLPPVGFEPVIFGILAHL
jgi:hypothetical protein